MIEPLDRSSVLQAFLDEIEKRPLKGYDSDAAYDEMMEARWKGRLPTRRG